MDYAQHIGYAGKKSVGLKLHTQAEEPAPRPRGDPMLEVSYPARPRRECTSITLEVSLHEDPSIGLWICSSDLENHP